MTGHTAKLKRHPESAFRPIGDEGGLVVLPGRSEVKVLNPVGIKVFSLLDGAHTVDDIAAAVLEEFEVEADVAKRDIEAFLNQLRDAGMLEGTEAGGEGGAP